jgi:4'-phosphopantetheinyl transferase
MSSWLAPPACPALAEGEVHVWRGDLDTGFSPGDFLSVLSPDELERASRFHFERDRRHYQCARGLLRVILARYLKLPPGSLRFSYGSHGKPALAGTELRFNLSHSGGLALLAVAGGGEVGVDIEQVKPRGEVMNIAERFFSPGEIVWLRAQPPDLQQRGFFRLWTRKEALIKAIGLGLSMPLNQFSALAEPPSAVRPASEGPDWYIFDLDPGAGYTGAVAVEIRNCRTMTFDCHREVLREMA